MSPEDAVELGRFLRLEDLPDGSTVEVYEHGERVHNEPRTRSVKRRMRKSRRGGIGWVIVLLVILLFIVYVLYEAHAFLSVLP